MKQIVSDFKDELEQNLNSGIETFKAEPKKFFQSAKTAITVKPPKPSSDFGKALEKMASDKPAPSKKMMGKITDLTAAVSAKRTEDLRKRFEQIRDEAINKGKNEQSAVIGGSGNGPEIKVGSKKLTPVQQSIKNAERSTELKDTGGIG